MPIFRMPVVLHANCPHANRPHANSPHANIIVRPPAIWSFRVARFLVIENENL